jgi:hypothetical protein
LIGALYSLSISCPSCATAQEFNADLLYPEIRVKCRICGFEIGTWDRLRSKARPQMPLPEFSDTLLQYEEAERLLDAAWTKVYRNDTADTAFRVGRAAETVARSRACLDAHPDPAAKS